MLAACLALAACGSQAPPAAGGGAPASPSFDPGAAPLMFTSDAAAKSISFRLVAAHDPSSSGFNFNGYAKGALAVTVPAGWRVTIDCENRGPLNHSCAVVKGPNDSGPAFAGAASPNPVAGLPPNQSATFTFTADRAGSYRLACLVPGHEQGGMWDTLTVTTGGTPAARLNT